MAEECADWENIASTVQNQKYAETFAQQSLEKGIKLRNGSLIPAIGLGTFGLQNFPNTAELVSCALETGYRLIDTSAQYENEESVGEGITISGLPRNKIFVTTKIAKQSLGYQATMDSFFHSLNCLDLDYLDLLLLQWPCTAKDCDSWEEINLASWKAVTELYREGYVHAIGVANFMPHHLRALLETPEPPMVNQIEFHPGWAQLDNVLYCQSHDIQVAGWGVFGSGRLLQQDFVLCLAEKYKCTPAQICLRYALQHKVIPLPKTSLSQHLRENVEALQGPVLSESDMQALDALSQFSVNYSGEDPDRL